MFSPRIVLPVLVGPLLLVSCLVASYAFGINDAGQGSFDGKDYIPPQPFLLPIQFDGSKGKSTGLADWSLIRDHKLKIKQVRILCSPGGKNGEAEWVSDSPEVTEMFSHALQGGVRRYALSDFSPSRPAFFDQAFAVIVVKAVDQDVIIGVSNVGFYLGVRRGTQHQLFESWLLAKLVDDVMLQKTGQRIDEMTLSRMSGELNIEEQRKIYERSRRQ